MSERRQTFRDPKTGEEIESTVLARTGAGLIAGLGGSLGFLLGSVWPARLLLALLAVALGSIVGSGLAVLFMDPVHDGIARLQHLRRQRLLKRRLLEQEWSGVPDGALSRASTPGEPGPTDTSLSRAEAPEEPPPRLRAAVDTAEKALEQRVEASTRTLSPRLGCTPGQSVESVSEKWS
jgi:hypothetical protein